MSVTVITAITILFYGFGLVFALTALWRSRTPQGATAWVVALLTMPFIAVPFFLLFGRNKFLGYVKERKELDKEAQAELKEADSLYHQQASDFGDLGPLHAAALLGRQPGFTKDNRTQLLVDGEQTFQSMLEAIEGASKYILFQFYIYREDESGTRFKEALIRKAQAGVKVYFLYDSVGTTLSKRFVRDLVSSGVHVESFQSTKGWDRLQINFRNHRKVLVVDGEIAFVGGFNIGDDYLGKWKSIGPWRDTHVKTIGPSAMATQLSFLKDWFWAREEIIDLDWQSDNVENGANTLVLHTGPADEAEVCLLAHLSLIHSAKKRIWISNPYFVPPEGLANALSLAVLRGVDVRVIVPSYSDNLLVMYASQNYISKLLNSGIKFFRYMPGFLHQKVMLIDDTVALVGSANIDSRSFFINFEIMAISMDPQFLIDMQKMLEKDFAVSEELTPEFYLRMPLWKKFLSRAANLLAPVL